MLIAETLACYVALPVPGSNGRQRPLLRGVLRLLKYECSPSHLHVRGSETLSRRSAEPFRLLPRHCRQRARQGWLCQDFPLRLERRFPGHLCPLGIPPSQMRPYAAVQGLLLSDGIAVHVTGLGCLPLLQLF